MTNVAQRTIPPSGIILTSTALHTPSLPRESSSKMCLELGPSVTCGRTSVQRGSFGLSLRGLLLLLLLSLVLPVTAAGALAATSSSDSLRAKIWEMGHSLPEKWEVSISTWERVVCGAARRMITLLSVPAI